MVDDVLVNVRTKIIGSAHRALKVRAAERGVTIESLLAEILVNSAVAGGPEVSVTSHPDCVSPLPSRSIRDDGVVECDCRHDAGGIVHRRGVLGCMFRYNSCDAPIGGFCTKHGVVHRGEKR